MNSQLSYPPMAALAMILGMCQSCSSIDLNYRQNSSTAAPSSSLQPGDIVVRASNAIVRTNWQSNFSNRDNHRFSHSGIVSRVNTASGKVLVLHAHAKNPGKFAAEVSLEQFTKSHDWAAYRVTATQENHARAIHEIKAAPGKKIAFDYGFALNDAGGWYCAELVYRIWQKSGVDLVPNPPYLFGRQYIPIDALYFNNPHVQLVFDSSVR